MQTKAFIRFLETNRMPVFTLDDAVKILQCSRPYASLFLHRCIKGGSVGRVEKGTYYAKERSNEYEIASHILHPSYISLVSALSYYGMTTQIPRIVYIVSTKRHRRIRNVMGYDIVFKRIKTAMLFGYHKDADGNVFMAYPEKAIVDAYYFNEINDLDDSMLEKPARIDVDRLVLYAKRSAKRPVMLKVSELLADHGYKKQAKTLKMASIGALDA